jgi:hypothetical protein
MWVGVCTVLCMGTGYLLTVLVLELICMDSRPVVGCQLHNKNTCTLHCVGLYPKFSPVGIRAALDPNLAFVCTRYIF